MYDEKNLNYFSNIRSDIFDLLPEKIDRVLEVGCGTGETLYFIKSKYKNVTTVGIELTESIAAIAAKKVDIVKNLDVESSRSLIELGKFDLILLLDVLEHLRDPWNVLKSLVEDNLVKGGVVITSIPNARNHKLLVNLIRGDFDYSATGILDRTHLRFFTKNSMLKMIKDANLEVIQYHPTNLDGSSRSSIINKITFGVLEELFAVQYIVKSKKI